LGEEIEIRPLLAHCHLGLGKLYRRAGDRPVSRPVLRLFRPAAAENTRERDGQA
jgi:hypothetical protein